MTVREIEGGLLAARGWRVAATCAHIKGSTGDKFDLAVLSSERDCVAAGVFTTNLVKAAPVIWCQQHLPASNLRAIVVNSGNANACTGEQGMRDTEEMAQLAASHLGIEAAQVLVASTGVIGIPMPMERLRSGMGQLELGSDGNAFIDAIMTTDTRRKQASVAFEAGGREVHVSGVTKGAGMIHPNMATMLCFVVSDAVVEGSMLPTLVKQAADRSFNMLTVDGDTSTNDTLVVLCNGAAENQPIKPETAEAALFEEAVETVCLSLARQMAADGEGASKLLEVRLTGAVNEVEARQAARAVVSSNLVKCAMYGNDPNWGRIMCALGYAGVTLDERHVDIAVNGHKLVSHGLGTGFDATAASKAMRTDSIVVEVELGLGSGTATALGCDMTPDYVTFNADYTT